MMDRDPLGEELEGDTEGDDEGEDLYHLDVPYITFQIPLSTHPACRS